MTDADAEQPEISRAARRLLEAYPRIFFACHERHVRDADTGAVISDHQASILQHLDAASALSVNALAEHMGVTPGTMSVAVTRLVNLGYVWREKDSADSRRVLLRLTPAGVRVREAQSVLTPSRVEALVRCLTPAERDAAVAVLEVLAAAAMRIGRPPMWAPEAARGADSGPVRPT